MPIFLLALLVQLLAPVSTRLAMAADPFMATICHGDTGTTSPDNSAPAPHADCCALCQIAHAGSPTLEVVFSLTHTDLELTRALLRSQHRVDDAHISAFNARGPPSLV